MRLPEASLGVSVALHYLPGSLVREEIYYTIWFNTKQFYAIITNSRGKPRGIKPDFRIKKE